METLLETKNLTAGYPGKKVIDNLNFKLKKGKIYALIGPNGAGKTTLFRVIAGILKPWQGTILWKGENLNRLSPRVKAKLISYLPQGLPTHLSLLVEEVLSLGRIPYLRRLIPLSSKDKEIIRHVAREMSIETFLSRRVCELSGGEIQRVFIAQALVQEPELLLLDEPVAHLDLSYRVKILDFISQLKTKGMTIFMILHDLNLASEYADYLILLSKGKIHSQGAPEEVLTYQTLEEVYETIVIVENNRFTGRPHIYLIPEEKRKV